jgi:hypothetical protein
VTEEFGVTVSEIQGKKRDRRIIDARQIICHIMVVRMRLTLKYTGVHALGGRDHTTVMHSIRMFRNMSNHILKFKCSYLLWWKQMKKEILQDLPMRQHLRLISLKKWEF